MQWTAILLMMTSLAAAQEENIDPYGLVGGAVVSTGPEGQAALALDWAGARRVYEALKVTATRESGALRKTGRNVTCRERTDAPRASETHSCLILLGPRATIPAAPVPAKAPESWPAVKGDHSAWLNKPAAGSVGIKVMSKAAAALDEFLRATGAETSKNDKEVRGEYASCKEVRVRSGRGMMTRKSYRCWLFVDAEGRLLAAP